MDKEAIKKPKIIAIVGQTSSGKTALAISIAKAVDGEVISVDSRQVYKGLNIGTGKVTRKEMGGVRHHLLDVATPRKVFSVSDFVLKGEKAIADIQKRGKVPILCGGTGLYLDALLKRIEIPAVPPNLKLRRALAKKSPEKLFAQLQKLDSARASSIDRHNPVRLIRAIEIAKTLGSVPEKHEDSELPYQVITFGIKWSEADIKKRIHDRLLSRISAGMVSEVKKLHERGLTWKRMEELGLEYRFISRHLQGSLSKKEMLSQLEQEIVRYSKRQVTWFKRDARIHWLSPKQLKQSEKLAKAFLQ